MENMSISRALAEIKLLDKRIEKTLRESKFVGMGKQSSDKMPNGVLKKDFKSEAKSAFDSLTALIDRRKKIKSAIATTNATTTVDVAGTVYTISAAIERKNTLELEERFLQTLERQYASSQNDVEMHNDHVNDQLQSRLADLLGKDGVKDIASLASDFSARFLADNSFELIDSLGVAKVIEKMRKDIEDFKLEVDFSLSTVNTLTMITID